MGFQLSTAISDDHLLRMCMSFNVIKNYVTDAQMDKCSGSFINRWRIWLPYKWKEVDISAVTCYSSSNHH